jgi:hypothetical protein
MEILSLPAPALLGAALLELLAIPIAAAQVGRAPLTLAWKPVFFALYASVAVSATCMMRSTQIVYHPGRRSIAWVPIAVGTHLGLVAVLVPFLDVAPLESKVALSIYPVMLCAYLWTAVESFRCWLRYRGVADLDPVVVDRFRIWGSAAALIVPWVATSFAARGDPGLTAISTLIGVASSGALWIAFRPPAFYRRWLGATR